MEQNPIFCSLIAGKLILVVEDETDIRLLLARGLNFLYGANCVEARNGAEAIELSLRDHPDVILMDIRLPVLDGDEAFRVIRANPKTKDIPVVFETAKTNIGEKQLIDKGYTDHDGILYKPFTLDRVVEKLERLFEFKAISDNTS